MAGLWRVPTRLRRDGVVARGERVVLRRIRARDRDELVALTESSRAFHRPWVDHPPHGRVFASLRRRLRRKDFDAVLVCRAEDAAIVGVVNVSQIVGGCFCSAYLGYYVFEPFARRGYMSEGLRLAVAYAFERHGLHRLEANIQSGNTASLALVRKLGFRREGFSPRYLKICGEWRDHERWALLNPVPG